jgi:hypothetical protein
MVALYGVVGRSGGSSPSARTRPPASAANAAAIPNAKRKAGAAVMDRSFEIKAATLGEKRKWK